MRKLLPIVCFAFAGMSTGDAQITITSADMPTPTKMFINATDTLPNVSIGNNDTMQTWNMITLTQHTTDTSIVMNYSDHPNSLFSTANTVMLQKGEQDFYGYLVNSPNSFELIGGGGIVSIQGDEVSVNQVYTPGSKLFNFPASFDSSFVNDYEGNAKFYYGGQVQGLTIDSIHSRSTVHREIRVDAWGELITPLDTFNVLRVKEVSQQYDTIMAYFFGDWNTVPGGTSASETTTYYWWANGIGTALATATMRNDSTIESIQWLAELPTNPALEMQTSVTNVSCEGQCDGAATANALFGAGAYTYLWSSGDTTATTTGLCPGTYTVTVTDSTGSTVTSVAIVNAPPAPIISPNGDILTASSGSSYQWLLNDSPISGATNMTYIATQSGDYSVIVTKNGCTDTSAVHNYTNTIGIYEATANSNTIALYPNPANNEITLITSGIALKESLQVEIHNELGQIVKTTVLTTNATNTKATIDISTLPQGAYFVILKNSTTFVNKKFIKQ